ncbi:hypothetical protein BURPS1710A_2529 [Burkholderia pseudomallei 1710a]|uniref:Uncharacterized protein n=1 Tax=Burkholderia pseudomallei 1710a TaxID=320371 RepID=A0A0E1W8X9_BURPE|nr:hypothetical protein BURPS1710A_2529 [Burkholderia pseudomallei 1710a]
MPQGIPADRATAEFGERFVNVGATFKGEYVGGGNDAAKHEYA